MNKKQKIIVSITGIFIVLLALVGLTYAYFLTRITGNENDKSISVTTAKLSVVYQDDNNQIITKENIIPNTLIGEKEFKVVNDGTGTATYSIVLDNIENTFERNEDLKFTITRKGTTEVVATGNVASGSHQIIKAKEEILAEEIDEYIFKLEYVEAGVDQSKDMDSNLSFRINIENEATTWDNSEPTWLKDGEETLINAIKSTSTYVEPENLGVTANTTTPGKTESLETEAIISSIEDDYGTSYYYRGNIENNYVNYNGMCWRIVRVQGDGTIKLALADEDYECNDTGALASSITAYMADPTSEQFRYLSEYKIDPGSGILTIENVHYYNPIINDLPTVFDHSLKKGLEAFKNGGYIWNFATAIDGNLGNELYIEQKIIDTSKLVDTSWCNNEAVVAETETKVMFDSYYRLSSEDENIRVPKLKCNTKGISYINEKIPEMNNGNFEMKDIKIDTNSVRVNDIIGTLTSDELVLAGAVYHDFNINPTHYLMDNATGFVMMTMTPAYFNVENVFPTIIGMTDSNNGTKSGTINSIKTNENSAIRPVIALKSDVVLDKTISGQTGTATNPFVIG